MKRSMWGIALLAAAAGLWSCNGDPTGDLRAGEKVVADPSSVFVEEGANKFVTVELVDGQGNQLATEFAAQDVGAGITVVKDPTFLQTTIGTRLPTQERFVVTGLTPSVNSFVVTAGDVADTIPVRVLPTFFGATFSSAAPAQNQPVTITPPAGFTFGPNAGVVIGADTGVVATIAADGSTLTFIPRPNFVATKNVAVVSDVRSALFSSVPLTIPTTDSISMAAIVPVTGTDDPSTAPTIAGPPTGQTAAFFDIPDFAASIDHFYKLNLTEAGDYTITTDWSIGNDVDQILCVSDVTCSGPSLNFAAATGNKPESATYTLPAGTHVIFIEDFGAIQDQFGLGPGTPAIGAFVSIKIAHL
jgi:hypothetical protein